MRKSPEPQQSGLRQKIMSLDKRYHAFRLAKFAIATGTGFLLAEGILMLGVLLLYGRSSAPGDAYSSPVFLALDFAALGLGVALSFFLNERFTVKVHKWHKNEVRTSRPFRLLKFEGVSAMGNATTVGVQLVLLAAFSIAPVIGTIIGAVVSYPITYVISMHFVWKPVAAGPADKALSHHRHQTPKKSGLLPSPVTAAALLVSLYAIGQILHRRKR
jgi:putative flippase GtrA